MTRKSSISYRTEPGIFTGNLLGERAAAELRRFLRKQIDKRAQFLEGTVLLENQRFSRFLGVGH